MPADCENWPITVTLLGATGKDECRQQKPGRNVGSVQSTRKIARPLTIKEIARPFALPITKIERRLLCINRMRRQFPEAKLSIFELTHMVKAASCRAYCLNDWQL
jgi:hypothetical protein